AWSVRWAEIAKPLSEEVQLEDLRGYLLQLSMLLHNNGCWIQEEDALKKYPELGNLILSRPEQYENGRDLIYEKLIKRIQQMREEEKASTSHWCHLPWEWWLLHLDFKKGIK